MSAVTDAWLALYSAQTGFLGVAVTATVGAVTDKAIPSAINLEQILAAGGLAEGGGYTIQMPASAFTVEPPKATPISIFGVSLVVGGCKNNNGILYIDAVDFVASET